MPPPPPDHPYRLSCFALGTRHSHDYRPIDTAPQRCTCSSRKWTVTTGGILPATVACANCGASNRVATAYERGREDAMAAVRANATQ